MSPQSLEELLKNYRSKQARLAYLRSQLEMLEKYHDVFSGQMVNDQVSLSQVLTGMPHGTSVGDPVGRLAIDIASGKVSAFVKQIRDEMEEVRSEIRAIEPDVKRVEMILSALTEREKEVLEMKIMADMTWLETLDEMNKRHGNSYSKRSLQRLLDRAMEKATDVVK